MKKIIVSLLVVILLGWVPCPCQGRCSIKLECADGVPSHSCCQRQEQRNEKPHQDDPNRGCCCDHGLCHIDAAKIPTSQTVDVGLEFGADKMTNLGSSFGLVHDSNERDPLGRLILPKLNAGSLLPELSSLLI